MSALSDSLSLVTTGLHFFCDTSNIQLDNGAPDISPGKCTPDHFDASKEAKGAVAGVGYVVLSRCVGFFLLQ